jgi:hypothetical protein
MPAGGSVGAPIRAVGVADEIVGEMGAGAAVSVWSDGAAGVIDGAGGVPGSVGISGGCGSAGRKIDAAAGDSAGNPVGESDGRLGATSGAAAGGGGMLAGAPLGTVGVPNPL